MPQAWRLGIDVGGTFTDGIMYNAQTGVSYRAKVPSTPENQANGVLTIVKQLRALSGDSPVLSSFHHGTTVATNALLEGTGAKVALIVTEGFRDTLVIKRSQVPGGLGAWVVHPKQQPIVSLELTVSAPGRIAIDGSEVRPFEKEVFRQRLASLKRQRPEAVTVSFINSFANNSHEIDAASVLKEEFPGVPVTLSSVILPELMEYERTLTAVVSAMVRPKVQKYLDSLQTELGNMEIRVLRSDGGLASPALAKEFSCNLIYSGPAGGVAGVAQTIARKTRYKDLLSFDMGGTSTDVCLIQNGVASLRRETTVGDLTIRSPSVDVRTVGAGGGSIAHVPEVTKALRVGPESAGAVPGPAAYGKGGKNATVTDANVVLGYLPPALIGDSMKLDVSASHKAVQAIADALGLTVYEAAEGILKLANEKMYGAIKSVSIERGHDLREYSLVAFGGAGPLHACSLAGLCQSYPVIIPTAPGVLCALGDAITSLRHEVGRTYIRNLGEVVAFEIIEVCKNLAGQAAQVLESQGVPKERQKYSFEADMRYSGQALNLSVGFGLSELETDGLLVLKREFTSLHNSLFTYTLDLGVEVINLRGRAEEVTEEIILPQLERGSSDGQPDSKAFVGTTNIYWNGKFYVDAPILERSKLKDGNKISGPAIITEMDSSSIVMPDHRAEIDCFGNILMWPLASEEAIVVDHTGSITTQLVEAALANARLEMDGLILRSALSPAMREQLDYFPMISAGSGPNDGKMVVGQFGSYIQHFLKIWKGSIEEGDVFITNDPYEVQGGISHLNDMLVMLPVYHNGKRVAWAANQGHFTDVGGQTPGSLPINSHTIFQDGIQIPISKLYERGKLNTALQNIICRNSRTPDFARADLYALVAACRIASQRISEVCHRFGTVAFESALDVLLERNKVAFAELLRTKIPAGRMTFSDWMDDDGTGIGPWKVSCTMFKEPLEDGTGDRLVYDFDGTDPQAESGVNWLLSPTTWKMRSSAYLIKALDPSITLNDGAYDLMDVRIPLGTLLNPVRPAALACRTHLLGRTLDLMIGTLGQRQPQFMTAAGYSDSPHFFYSGWRADGTWFQLYQIGFGGVPARPIGDGMDGHSLFPSMKAVPNEFLELYFPLRIERYETICDSGGAGFYRGGNGVQIEYCFLRAGEISLHDDRWLTKPWGVNELKGGEPGARSSKTLVRAIDQTRVVLPSKVDFVAVREGDVLIWCTWGGGGYGLSYERPAEMVAREVREGMISRQGAKRYGVFLTDSLELDVNATNSRREKMIVQRKAEGKQDGEFEINRGGTLAEAFRRCQAETGLQPPKLPSGRTLRGPPARLPHIAMLHAKRQQEDREEFGADYERYA